MCLQSDVIPGSPVYSSRMEDGYALGDAALRRELAERWPGCYNRCLARRAFMRDTLGLPVGDDVLPLSNIPGIVPPYFLAPTTILALEQ